MRPIVLALLMLSSARTAWPQTGVRSADTLITAEVRRQLDLLSATTSIAAVHLGSGRMVEVRADVPMNSMSTIKIPIMLLAYRDAEAGRLNLDERVTLREEDMRGGSGLLRRLTPGATLTIRDLVDHMIMTSDNTATDKLIVKLGLERVNDMLRDLGFRETRLVQSLSQYFRNRQVAWAPERATWSDVEIVRARRVPGMSDAEFAAKEFAYAADSATWLGRTTAREMTMLLEGIYTAKYTNQTSSAAMMNHLLWQTSRTRLPATLRYRSDVRIAHKTGDYPPISGSDVGIIMYAGGAIIISVYTNANRGDFAQLELTIGRIAELLVNRW